MMAAINASGITKIENSAKEPEIDCLMEFLNLMGGNIKRDQMGNIVIKGSNQLTDKIEFDVIPDRIEAGTFIIAVAAVGGKVRVNKIIPDHLLSLINLMKKLNITLDIGKDYIEIDSDGSYKAIDIETSEYPGFPTDLQAQWMSMMVKANGSSFIKETIYLDRFTHISELLRMGADIRLKHETAYINGVEETFSAPVMCTDIRASAALVISALYSKGKTDITRIYHIDRGYDKIENKFSLLGANIKRISN